MMIDFHTHIFPDRIAAATLDTLSDKGGIPFHTNGTASGLNTSMQQAGIRLSLNLPVMTSPAQVHKVNDSLLKNREAQLQQGILSFAGIHPDFENYKEELRLRKSQGFAGIKLHPAYQNCDLDDERFMRIIDCASDLGLIIVTHAGLDIGIPGHDFADVRMILHVIDKLQPEGFVLAHMGGWQNWKDVEAYLAGAPVFLDTAFSVGKHGMSSEDFCRLCRKHGTDRILFGSDSPWADQTSFVKEISQMPLTDSEQHALFEDNAEKLLKAYSFTL